MSLKSKAFASAAALTMVGGLSMAVAPMSASAATPSCGSNCIEAFNHNFGTHAHPNFVLDVLRQGEKVGQPIILFRVANSDAAEDFTFANEGLVSDFFAAQLVSAAVDLHYGGLGHLPNGKNYPDDFAYEIQYAPFGVDSGLCVGLAATAVANEPVTLQPCGVSSKTVWIADARDSRTTAINGYLPLINGSDTNFSQPFVLAYPAAAYPTDQPRPQLKVNNLTGFSDGIARPIGVVDNNQLWGFDLGVLR